MYALNESDLNRLRHIMSLKNPNTIDAELASFVNKYNRERELYELLRLYDRKGVH